MSAVLTPVPSGNALDGTAEDLSQTRLSESAFDGIFADINSALRIELAEAEEDSFLPASAADDESRLAYLDGDSLPWIFSPRWAASIMACCISRQ